MPPITIRLVPELGVRCFDLLIFLLQQLATDNNLFHVQFLIKHGLRKLLQVIDFQLVRPQQRLPATRQVILTVRARTGKCKRSIAALVAKSECINLHFAVRLSQ